MEICYCRGKGRLFLTHTVVPIIRPRNFLLFFFLFGASLGLFAQQRTVAGKVIGEGGQPLSGVTVSIKGTNAATQTNDQGAYSIAAPADGTLVFSFVGYGSQEVKIANRATVDLTMVAANQEMQQVVVVGYGTQKKVTVTGAVATVKGTELAKSPAVNLSNSLGGRLPGVTAIQGSGEPGYDGSTIRIRGTNTLGNSSALIVIDGIPDRAGGLDRLNPADIESISVLKDASAAIYGARAANGVILITTKRGKTGKPTVSYDFNQGWAQPTRIPKMMDAAQYATIINELKLFANVPANQWEAGWQAFQQTGSYTRADGVKVNATYSPEAIQKHRDGSDPWLYPNTDWYGQALKNWSPQSRHNLQLSGGSENVKYMASVGYQNQDGYYKNSATGYKQYDARVNLDAKVNKYINTSVGLTLREENRFFPTKGAGAIFRMLMRGKPTEQQIWPNGLPGPDIENGENPIVITTNATGYDKDTRDYIQMNGKFEVLVPWVEGLKFTGTGAVDNYMLRGKRWETPWSLYFWDKVSYEADGKTPLLKPSVRSTFTDPRLTQREEFQRNINLTGMMNYDRKFGAHTFNFLAGITKETVAGTNFNAFRRYFISPSVDELFAGGTAEQNNSGGGFERARLSYFGRVGYNYKEKYLAEFVWRNDGSYIFPETSRFGFFPGVLAGWNISEEDFFRNSVPFVDNLKIRASWGQMGNDQVYYNNALQEYAYLPTNSFGTYILNDQVQKTLFETRVANPDFTWEVANNSNVGLEGALFNNKLNFEFEYFYNKRTNILIQKQGTTPASTGMTLPPVNLGKMENKGWEFKVGYNNFIGDLRYTVSVNGGYSRNKILFWDENPSIPEYQRATGKGFGTSGTNFLAYEYDGVFRDAKEIAANTIDYSAVSKTLLPGDMRFKDINGDNKIDGLDKTRLDKNRDPRFTGGANINLSYKSFDLSILFQGAAGGLLFIGTESGEIGNYLEWSYNNRWSVEKPSSVDPRLANRGATYYGSGEYGSNTYWLRSSDYIRLKNIEIGYNLSSGIGKRIGISNLRLYTNALNLITWDKMKIWDPESTSGSGQYYPQARILNTGVRVTF